jgi:hypothetical protein
MIPPDVIVIAVTAMTSVGPVMITAVAGPVTGPVMITAVAGPARKAVIDMSAATGPMIITAVGGAVMKTVIDMTAAAISSTAAMTTTAMTATAAASTTATSAAAPPRVAVINGYNQHSHCQRTHGETLRDHLQIIQHDDIPDVMPIASTQRACPCPS